MSHRPIRRAATTAAGIALLIMTYTRRLP
jgi:hypothetical protein